MDVARGREPPAMPSQPAEGGAAPGQGEGELKSKLSQHFDVLRLRDEISTLRKEVKGYKEAVALKDKELRIIQIEKRALERRLQPEAPSATPVRRARRMPSEGPSSGGATPPTKAVETETVEVEDTDMAELVRVLRSREKVLLHQLESTVEQLNESKVQCRQAEEELFRARELRETLQEELDVGVGVELGSLRKQLQAMEAASQHDVHELLLTIRRLNTAMEKMNRDGQEQARKMQCLEDDLRAAERRRKEAEQAASATKAALEAKEAELAKAAEQAKAAKSKPVRARSMSPRPPEVATLKALLEKANDDLRQTERQLREAQAAGYAQAAMLQTPEGDAPLHPIQQRQISPPRLAALPPRGDAAVQTEPSQAEQEGAAKALQDLHEQLDAANASLEDATAANELLRKKVDELLAADEAKREWHKQHATQLLKDAEQLRKEYKALQGAHTDLQEQTEDIRATRDALLADCDKLGKECERLKMQLENESATSHTIQKQMSEIHNYALQEQNVVAALRDENNFLRQQLSELQAALVAKQQEVASKRQENLRLKRAHAEAKVAFQQALATARENQALAVHELEGRLMQQSTSKMQTEHRLDLAQHQMQLAKDKASEAEHAATMSLAAANETLQASKELEARLDEVEAELQTVKAKYEEAAWGGVTALEEVSRMLIEVEEERDVAVHFAEEARTARDLHRERQEFADALCSKELGLAHAKEQAKLLAEEEASRASEELAAAQERSDRLVEKLMLDKDKAVSELHELRLRMAGVEGELAIASLTVDENTSRGTLAAVEAVRRTAMLVEALEDQRLVHEIEQRQQAKQAAAALRAQEEEMLEKIEEVKAESRKRADDQRRLLEEKEEAWRSQLEERDAENAARIAEEVARGEQRVQKEVESVRRNLSRGHEEAMEALQAEHGLEKGAWEAELRAVRQDADQAVRQERERLSDAEAAHDTHLTECRVQWEAQLSHLREKLAAVLESNNRRWLLHRYLAKLPTRANPVFPDEVLQPMQPPLVGRQVVLSGNRKWTRRAADRGEVDTSDEPNEDWMAEIRSNELEEEFKKIAAEREEMHAFREEIEEKLTQAHEELYHVRIQREELEAQLSTCHIALEESNKARKQAEGEKEDLIVARESRDAQIDSMQAMLDKYRAEADAAQAAADSAKEELELVDARRACLMQQVEALQQEARLYETNSTERTTQVEQLCTAVSEQNAAYALLAERRGQLERLLHEREGELKEAKMLLEQSEEEGRALKEALEKKTMLCDSLAAESEEGQQERDELQADLKAAQEEQAALRRRLATEFERRQGKEAELSTAQRSLTEAREEVTRLKGRAREVEGALSDETRRRHEAEHRQGLFEQQLKDAMAVADRCSKATKEKEEALEEVVRRRDETELALREQVAVRQKELVETQEALREVEEEAAAVKDRLCRTTAHHEEVEASWREKTAGLLAAAVEELQSFFLCGTLEMGTVLREAMGSLALSEVARTEGAALLRGEMDQLKSECEALMAQVERFKSLPPPSPSPRLSARVRRPGSVPPDTTTSPSASPPPVARHDSLSTMKQISAPIPDEPGPLRGPSEPSCGGEPSVKLSEAHAAHDDVPCESADPSPRAAVGEGALPIAEREVQEVEVDTGEPDDFLEVIYEWEEEAGRQRVMAEAAEEVMWLLSGLKDAFERSTAASHAEVLELRDVLAIAQTRCAGLEHQLRAACGKSAEMETRYYEAEAHMKEAQAAVERVKEQARQDSEKAVASRLQHAYDHVVVLEEELSASKAKVVELEQHLAGRALEVRSGEQRVQELENQLLDIEGELDAKASRILELEGRCKEQAVHLEERGAEQQEFEATLSSLRGTERDLRGEIESLGGDATRYLLHQVTLFETWHEAQRSAIEEFWAAREVVMEASRGAREAETGAQVMLLKEKLQQSEEEKGGLQEALAKAAEELSDALERVGTAEGELQSSLLQQSELQDSLAEFTSFKEELQGEVAALKADYLEAQAEIVTLEEQARVYELRGADLAAALQQSEDERESKAEEVVALAQRVESLEAEVKRCEHREEDVLQLIDEAEARIAEMQDSLAQRTETIAGLEAKVTERDEDLARMREELEATQEDLEAKQKVLVGVTEELAQWKVRALQTEEDMTKRLHSCEVHVSVLEQSVAYVNLQLEEVQCRYECMLQLHSAVHGDRTSILNHLAAEREARKEDGDRHREEVAATQERIEKLLHEVADLREALGAAEEKERDLAKALKAAEATIDGLEQRLEEETAERSAMGGQLKEKCAELERYRREVHGLHKQVEQLEAHRGEGQREINGLRKAAHTASLEQAELQRTVLRLTEELAQSESLSKSIKEKAKAADVERKEAEWNLARERAEREVMEREMEHVMTLNNELREQALARADAMPPSPSSSGAGKDDDPVVLMLRDRKVARLEVRLAEEEAKVRNMEQQLVRYQAEYRDMYEKLAVAEGEARSGSTAAIRAQKLEVELHSLRGTIAALEKRLERQGRRGKGVDEPTVTPSPSPPAIVCDSGSPTKLEKVLIDLVGTPVNPPRL